MERDNISKLTIHIIKWILTILNKRNRKLALKNIRNNKKNKHENYFRYHITNRWCQFTRERIGGSIRDY